MLLFSVVKEVVELKPSEEPPLWSEFDCVHFEIFWLRTMRDLHKASVNINVLTASRERVLIMRAKNIVFILFFFYCFWSKCCH